MVCDETHLSRLSCIAALFAAAIVLMSASIRAQGNHPHPGGAAGSRPPPFVASTGKSFAALMDDAMAVMDYGMRTAPMNGDADHDLVVMMIPHHQGAIDMAAALLLNSKDPELRNLALGIITDQQNEIKVMEAWLERHR